MRASALHLTISKALTQLLRTEETMIYDPDMDSPNGEVISFVEGLPESRLPEVLSLLQKTWLSFSSNLIVKKSTLVIE
jgi:hypothetical protein